MKSSKHGQSCRLRCGRRSWPWCAQGVPHEQSRVGVLGTGLLLGLRRDVRRDKLLEHFATAWSIARRPVAAGVASGGTCLKWAGARGWGKGPLGAVGIWTPRARQPVARSYSPDRKTGERTRCLPQPGLRPTIAGGQRRRVCGPCAFHPLQRVLTLDVWEPAAHERAGK